MAGGNYGGSSIPTTAIGGETLYDGRNTAYKKWTCTSVVAKATADEFTYSGQTINVGTNPLEFIIWPGWIESNPTDDITFFCYNCNCTGPMNNFVLADMNNYTGNTGGVNTVFMPTIIGGGTMN